MNFKHRIIMNKFFIFVDFKNSKSNKNIKHDYENRQIFSSFEIRQKGLNNDLKGKENRIIIFTKRLKTSMWVSSHGRENISKIKC